ncbi:probable beta-D-xylosidase 7 isoform X1 [Asparagus officinalis]|uniref:probable beta-D-xylosidase 7 isoform X1 n=1 Tax=Asparagus officinalis TaxID=4686 RepID=UPI00098E1B3F|nr:probable beta-D-xylosidase 7 isoform X1 [Asparagus officinalis]
MEITLKGLRFQLVASTSRLMIWTTGREKLDTRLMLWYRYRIWRIVFSLLSGVVLKRLELVELCALTIKLMEYQCADYNFLTKTARDSWGFDGYITSDCDAVSIIHDAQGYASTPEDAVADVLKAGMDVNCGKYVQKYAASAVQQGKLSESDINRALHNLFSIRMRLGLFNGDPRNHLYGKFSSTDVCTEENKFLALEAAREGIVLLKNSGHLLPLKKLKTTSLGVIGPNANIVMLGNYAGPPCSSITPLEALQSYVTDTKFLQGCEDVACVDVSIDEVVQLAKSVDQVVMLMGLDLTEEKEKLDRVDLVLPGKQQMLITTVAREAKKPVILVLLCGGPVDVSFAKDDENIGGMLWAGYPGEAGGLAIADVIFGEHNPGGRLPVTWYPQDFTNVAMTDMRMRADPANKYPGRTYRFFTGKPVFEFGYGLSYSTFSYEFTSTTQRILRMNETIRLQAVKDSQKNISYDISKLGSEQCQKLKFSAAVRVNNHGPMDAKHSVLLFLRRDYVRGGAPRKQLIGFENVHLKARDKSDVEFDINPCKHLSRIEEDGRMLVDEGPHFLMVGDKEHEFSITG